MKHIFLSLVLILTLHLTSHAQWDTPQYKGNQSFTCVDYFSATDIWIGSSSFLYKTANGGASWTTKQFYDIHGNWISTSVVKDLILLDTSRIIATGIHEGGDREHILTTTNGGSSWSWAIFQIASPSPQYLNAMDMFSKRGVAVGLNGHIARTTDSSATWTVINRTSGSLYDVKFISYDTVLAVGEDLILRSFDGGESWTWTTQTGAYRNISCVKNELYIGVNGNTMLKSTDRGATFTTINLPFTYPGVLYAVDKGKILAAATDGIYLSKDGGAHWDKYVLPSYKQVRMFDFLTPTKGVAVGDEGLILKTDNLDGASIEPPKAAFSLLNGSEFCLGDSVKLQNTTANSAGFTYQWKLDGVPFSTTYHAAIKVNTAGTHTITLTANTGGAPSSASAEIFVKGHAVLSGNFIAVEDTTCAKNVVGFVLGRSILGAKYQLRKGFTPIGPEVTGNDSILRLTDTAGITTATAYNIKTVVSDNCFTDSVVTSKWIYIKNKVVDVAACIPPKKFCYQYLSTPGITQVAFNGISHSSSVEVNNYFDFSCCYQTTVEAGKTYSLLVNVGMSYHEIVQAWIDYNNDGVFTDTEQVLYANAVGSARKDVTIPHTAVTGKYLRMRIKSQSDTADLKNPCRVGCGQIKDYAIKIISLAPVADFTKTVSKTGCYMQVICKNNSSNSSSFIWDFGDGSPTSNIVNPTHTYMTSGTYTITLTATNNIGTNTTSQTVSVTLPPMPKVAQCVPVVNPQQGYSLSSLQIDTNSVLLNNISGYKDFTCSKQLRLRSAGKYSVTLTPAHLNYCAEFSICLDYNNDGIFTRDETVLLNPGGMRVCSGPVTVTMKLRETSQINTPLRMRLLVYSTDYSNLLDGCGVGNITGGEIDDFTVILDPVLPVKADFTVDKTDVCSNEWLTCINTSSYATRYLWDFGDGVTDSTESPYYHQYKQLGTYTVKLKVFNSISVDSITKVNYVRNVEAPQKPVITLDGKTLLTTIQADKYRWTNMDSVIVKGTTIKFNPPSDGNYQLVVTNNNGCENFANFAYFPFRPEFTVQSPAVCNDPGFIIFDKIPRNADYTIDWGNGNISHIPKGGGLPFNYYTAAGTYTIKVTGCNDLGCDSLIRTNYVTIYPKPETPVITEYADVLSTSVVAASYQWYIYGQLIQGATSSSYTPTMSGTYRVIVKNANCSATSPDFRYYPLRAIFSSDSAAFCGVTQATISFNNHSTNAISYYWDFGDGATSTDQYVNHLYAAPGLYTVKLKVCDTLHCDSLTRPDFVRIYSTPFRTSVTPKGDQMLCTDDSLILRAQTLPGAAYKWQFGGNDLPARDSQFVVNRWNAGFYNVIVTDKLGTGCSARSEVVSVYVDYNCVWPGDANNDHVVDHEDLLPIGLFYGKKGPVRSPVGDLWESYSAISWDMLQHNGSDVKHIDCNGDGVINENDTLAIHKNITLSHTFSPVTEQKPNMGDPVIYFKTTSKNYQPGTWITVDILLGDINLPAGNLYGLAFKLLYDQSLVEPGTATIQFPSSWFTQNGKTLTFSAIGSTSNVGYFAVTATDHLNRSGYGKIATLRFKSKTTIDHASGLKFSATGIKANDATGSALPLSSQDYTVTIDPVVTNLNDEVEAMNLNIYPNPFEDRAAIAYTLDKKSQVNVELYSALGQKLETLLTTEQVAGEHQLSLSTKEKGYVKGVYYIKLTVNGSTSLRKIVML